MKQKFKYLKIPLLLLIAGFGLGANEAYADSNQGHHYPSGTAYRVHSSMPERYLGTAYFYQGKFYTGGRFETGQYRVKNQFYTNRYYHAGKYIYGGNQDLHLATNSLKNYNATSNRSNN